MAQDRMYKVFNTEDSMTMFSCKLKFFRTAILENTRDSYKKLLLGSKLH